jgi:hypothetical protein
LERESENSFAFPRVEVLMNPRQTLVGVLSASNNA